MWRWTRSRHRLVAVDRFGEQQRHLVTPHVGPPRLASFVEHVAELASAPVQPHLRGGDRDPELLGDRLVRQVVDVLQHHHAARSSVGELVERVGDFARGRLGRRRRSRADARGAASTGSTISSKRVGLLAAAALRTWVAGGVRGDAVQPGGERGVAPELAEAPPGSEIRLLHHVPCVLLVAGEAQGQRVGVDVGSPHELVERRPVAIPGRGDDSAQLVVPTSVFVFIHETRPQPAGLPPSRPIGRAEIGPGQALEGAPEGRASRRGAALERPGCRGAQRVSLWRCVLAVPAAVLLHLDALAVVDLVLDRDVVPPLAVFAGEGDLDPLVALAIAQAPSLLLDDLDDAAGADGAATLTDGEPDPFFHRDRA